MGAGHKRTESGYSTDNSEVVHVQRHHNRIHSRTSSNSSHHTFNNLTSTEVMSQVSQVTIEDPVNPFAYDFVHQKCTQYCKMFIVYVVLLVPRVIVAIVSLLIGYLMSVFILCGYSQEDIQQRPIQRIFFRKIMSMCARALLWSFGFWWISVSGKENYGKPLEAPIIICNHVSFVEVLYMVYAHQTMAVGKDTAVNAPFIGKIAQALQCVAVARTDPQSRKKCTMEIRRRTRWAFDDETKDALGEFGRWKPLLIFPEGTCTNAQSIIQFKAGAFTPGIPVQPVTVTLPYKSLDLAFVGPVSGADLIITMCGQIYNRMKVRYLPVHVPNEAERTDALLFAAHARNNMAMSLGVPLTDHTYEDVILGNEIEAMKLPFDEFNVEMGNFNDFGLEKALEQLRRFAQLDRDGDGVLNVTEFGEFFNLNDHPQTRDALFRKWDRNKDGTINFREFLTQVASQQIRMSRRRAASATGFHHVQLPQISPAEHRRSRSTSRVVSPASRGGTPVSSPVPVHMIDEEEQTLMYAFTLCFGAFDEDHKGHMTTAEFVKGMRGVCPGLSRTEIDSLFREMDVNQNGVVELDEFLDYCTTHPVFMEHLFQLMQEHDINEGITQ